MRRAVLKDFVIEQRQSSKISLGRAAAILNISYSEFFDLLGRKGLSFSNANSEEINEGRRQREKALDKVQLMIVIADATALIALSRIQKLTVFKELFGTIYIPDVVYRETVEETDIEMQKNAISDATADLIKVVRPSPALEFFRTLGNGSTRSPPLLATAPEAERF